jgi:tetratricopeptide (TPR) repeat protein/tRNA A-37 threonylcarbamoyl transferase component Bud32
MLRADDRVLVDLAASVADGTPVDWNTAEAEAAAPDRRLVRHLRLVEGIASLHRSIPDNQVIEDLAASVADGRPVNWAAAETGAAAAERRIVRHLRLVESIASLHRSTALEDTEPMLPIPQQEPSGSRWGRLVVLESLGAGTSSQVSRAWDSALHREVALKLLHDDGDHRDAHTRLLEEARRLARVRHTHVVQVYGAEEHDNRVGLWMELVRGESLEHIVKTRGSFGAREAALIGLDLCAALAAVHGAGLLHRDVKAQNVLRESGGRIVLMDFGTGEELAGSNRLVGTPLYLAPEIFKGQTASVQSDLYSLGVLLYYLCTGQFPVLAGSMPELAQAHQNKQRRPLRDMRPDLPETFVGVVERALDPNPDQRYRSAGEMEAALRASLDTQPRSVADVRSGESVPRRKVGTAFVALAAALVALITGLVWWTRAPAAPGSTAVRTLALLSMSDGTTTPVDFAAGFTDQLISTLGQISSLRVTSGSSVLPLKGQEIPRPEIAKMLDVDALVETTLVTNGTELGHPGVIRVDARLYVAGFVNPTWSGTFERQRGDAFTLQAEMARAIADALNAPVTTSEAARLRQGRQTNPAAEEAYLQGRIQLAQYGPEPARRALDAFKRALLIDPDHAPAHAGAARAYVRLGSFGASSQPEARASALAETTRALELNPALADAHAVQADLKFFYDWDWPGAEREYQRSLELNPSLTYARTYYGQYLAARKRFDEAVEQTAIAQQLDPQSGEALRMHGLILYYKRDYVAAEAVLRRSAEREPDAPSGHLLLGRIAEARGRFQESLELTERASELSGAGGVPLRVAVIRLQALTGRKDEARAALADLEAQAAARTLRVGLRDRAYVMLALGETDAALDAFEEALQERDQSLMWLGVDPRLDAIKDNPRFVAILRQIGLS